MPHHASPAPSTSKSAIGGGCARAPHTNPAISSPDHPSTLGVTYELRLAHALLFHCFTPALKKLGRRAGCSYQSMASTDLDVGNHPPATPDAVR